MTIKKSYRYKKQHNQKKYLSSKKHAFTFSRLNKKNSRHHKKDTFVRINLISSLVWFTTLFFVIVYSLIYLQDIYQDLPSPDKPFGNKNTATEIYAADGELLYRVFDEEDRDPVDMEEVPPLLIWTYLAAEDINFYDHQGIDLKGISRCAWLSLQQGEVACGGSTITQQLIRKTALSDEVKVERKVKEIIMAMQIEQLREKEEILEMYFTVVPEGSNIYGITRAADFYFGKDLAELNLAEMAVLASIPQNPAVLSPTKSVYPESNIRLLDERKNYVLDQMENHRDKINKEIAEYTGEEVEHLTEEMIASARERELVYRDPNFKIKAPHFVFYALAELQSEQSKYKNGKRFTLEELETGGYKIYTTLNPEIQRVAEVKVKEAVATYGSRFGAENAALVAINPKDGKVLAMVGSKDYFTDPTPLGCSVGINCKFEPQVNVVDTLQAYGSTIKPMIYYHGFMNGMLTPESKIGDYPIRIRDYQPKNWDGDFSGYHSARYMLVNSRNIPAIILLDELGVNNFISSLRGWGYTTLNNPNGYGPSFAVGGGEVTLIEHAQAYGVFANQGKLTKAGVINKIVDKDGNIVYEHQVKSKQVADPRGVYLVNNILNGRNNGPGVNLIDRDVAGKTGTSEDQKETLYVGYTPNFVAAGMLINNDNSPMIYGATGHTSVRPWMSQFFYQVYDHLGDENFETPYGVKFAGGDILIEGISNPYYNVGMSYPNYISVNALR